MKKRLLVSIFLTVLITLSTMNFWLIQKPFNLNLNVEALNQKPNQYIYIYI